MNEPCHAILFQTLSECAGETLWIVDENLSASSIAGLRPRAGLRALTNRVDTYRALHGIGLPTLLSDFETNAGTECLDHVVYRVSKERALVHHCINESIRWLRQGGELLLIGQKNEGIKTHARKGEGVFGCRSRIEKQGLCYTARLEKLATGELLPSDNYAQLREVRDGDFLFFSKPGIFGWGKVDQGSRLLVETLRAHQNAFNTSGKLLDLGCGWGYLILATADMSFSARVASDNNVTALIAAEKNFAQAKLQVRCLADDCGSEITEGFDLILCNPPFHQGFSTSDVLSRKFVEQSARLLDEKGAALFVVNQFIPLEKLAAPHFPRIDLLAHEKGFKVFALRRQ